MAWNGWEKRSAYLLVKCDWKAGEKVWKTAKSWRDTIGAWMLTGDWGVMVWVDARSWEDLYAKACELRAIPGVSATSTHFVYKGMTNGKWWWENPAGAWMWVRSPHLNGEMKNVAKWKWANSVTSVPGDWDYLVWAGGRSWDEVWKGVGDANAAGWQTQTMVPVRSWWNKSWKKDWWAKPAKKSAWAAAAW